ncbi:hypothetical protein M514_10860, partial [Trichuris suis]
MHGRHAMDDNRVVSHMANYSITQKEAQLPPEVDNSDEDEGKQHRFLTEKKKKKKKQKSLSNVRKRVNATSNRAQPGVTGKPHMNIRRASP